MRLYVVQASIVCIYTSDLCRNHGENSIVLSLFCWLFYVNLKERESVFEVADDYDKIGMKIKI